MPERLLVLSAQYHSKIQKPSFWWNYVQDEVQSKIPYWIAIIIEKNILDCVFPKPLDLESEAGNLSFFDPDTVAPCENNQFQCRQCRWYICHWCWLMWKWEVNPWWHIFPQAKDQVVTLMLPSVWKVSDVVGAGQRLGGRGPPNYGIIPKWELSPNYPAFGIIPELSSDRRQGASDRIGSLSWHLHYPLILNHYLLILGLDGLEIELIGYWTLHVLFNNAAKIRS